jgi:uncharacterized membrane protein YcjF (UPF0283 family)
MFNAIGKIRDKNLRDQIGELFGQLGGSTPTFQVVTEALLQLAVAGSETLARLVELRASLIDLGAGDALDRLPQL